MCVRAAGGVGDAANGGDAVTTVAVAGGPDLCILVRGGIDEDFYYHGNNVEAGDLLAFSDGTILRVVFDGGWHVTVVAAGSAVVTVEPDTAQEFSDRATVVGDVRWVVHGRDWKAAT